MKLKTAPKGQTIHSTSNVVFNLINKNSEGKYPASFDIPEEDEVYMEWIDKNGNKQEKLRHIRYAIGESSIFVDEQSSNAADKRGTIRFTDGMLIVNSLEKTKLQYLEICNYNKINHDNGSALNLRTPLFMPDSQKHEAKKRYQESLLKQKLKTVVNDFTAEELEGYCLAFNVNYEDTEIGHIIARERFYQMIDYDPYRFEKEVESDVVRHKTVLGYALRDKIISFDRQDRVFYNEIGGKTKILDVPSYAEPVDYFVDMALTRTEYKQAYQDIKSLVEKGKKSLSSGFKRTNAYKLLQRAMEFGIAKNNLGTIVAANIGELGEPMGGSEGATIFLQEDKSAYKKLEEMVLEAENDKSDSKQSTTTKRGQGRPAKK